jgi:hypothetical protein
MDAYTPFWLPVFAIAFDAVIGVVSAVYPTLRAAMLDSLCALKYETDSKVKPADSRRRSM